MSTEAIARKRICSRPSVLRTQPPGSRRPFGARALRVVELLTAGWTRLEAAREVGLDKANVRVIELRARRRGMLAGVETRVEPWSPCAVPVPSLRDPGGYAPRAHEAAIRMALAANPADTDTAIAARTGVTPSTVAFFRDRLGLPRSKRGPRGPRSSRAS